MREQSERKVDMMVGIRVLHKRMGNLVRQECVFGMPKLDKGSNMLSGRLRGSRRADDDNLDNLGFEGSLG